MDLPVICARCRFDDGVACRDQHRDGLLHLFTARDKMAIGEPPIGRGPD